MRRSERWKSLLTMPSISIVSCKLYSNEIFGLGEADRGGIDTTRVGSQAFTSGTWMMALLVLFF